MSQVIVRMKFDAGHRVVGMEKCSSLHGHGYHIEIFVQSLKLREAVVLVEKQVGSWIEKYFNCVLIIWKEDPDFDLLCQCSGAKEVYISLFNPTAFNLADFLLNVVCPDVLDGTGIIINKIRLHESSDYCAEVSL